MTNVVAITKSAELEDQIDELKGIVGQSPEDELLFEALDLPKQQRRIVGLLMKRQLATKEALFTAMYYDVDEDDRPESDGMVDVQVSHLRKKLAVHEVTINTSRGEGWYITNENKTKLRLIAETFIRADDTKAAMVKETVEALRGRKPVKPPKGPPRVARDFVIDKNVPLPTKKFTKVGYPFAQMEVGDSFLVRHLKNGSSLYSATRSFRSSAPQYADWKFAIRPVDGGGVRCWRSE